LETVVVNKSNENERRRELHTLVDPKVLSTLIPVLIAVASAFMVHDRSINTMQVTINQHDKTITSIQSEIAENRALKDQTITSLITLKQQMVYVEKHLDQLTTRIRQLEKDAQQK
jgi:septal ring factor EnvC (AmiA/AmiB activator)